MANTAIMTTIEIPHEAVLTLLSVEGQASRRGDRCIEHVVAQRVRPDG